VSWYWSGDRFDRSPATQERLERGFRAASASRAGEKRPLVRGMGRFLGVPFGKLMGALKDHQDFPVAVEYARKKSDNICLARVNCSER
jgi:hypothetical protein